MVNFRKRFEAERQQEKPRRARGPQRARFWRDGVGARCRRRKRVVERESVAGGLERSDRIIWIK